ncbi:MAG: class I SAM-dependent RNA methyltransferase, partial [Spirochaetia bacterium]|nr:class I SAM-dependent RNA methyltransferase [Spirochaetia bacterium]
AGPDSFSQLNPTVAEKLYLHVAEAVPENTKNLVDLYCGAGILSLLLAKKIAAAGGKVIGVESSGISNELAGVNAHENKVANAKFVRADARVGFEKIVKDGTSPEVIVLNPPRSGVEKELLEQIADAGVTKIIYVSCKASTLARDLGILAGRGYKLSNVQSFDMLPQTTHVESVAVIEKI